MRESCVGHIFAEASGQVRQVGSSGFLLHAGYGHRIEAPKDIDVGEDFEQRGIQFKSK